MKKLLMSILVVLGVLCLGSAALAEGFTIYGDYSILGTSDMMEWWGDSISYITIGAEYDFDPFVVGGVYGFAIGTDPEVPAPFSFSGNIMAVYGGYTFLSSDTFSLAGIGGYLSAALKEELDGFGIIDDWNFTSLAVGLKGTLSMEPFSITGLYLYGVSPEFEETYWCDICLTWHTVTIDEDVSISYFELRGAYQFSDSWGAYLGYRSLNGGILVVDGSLSGFIVGAEYKF